MDEDGNEANGDEPNGRHKENGVNGVIHSGQPFVQNTFHPLQNDQTTVLVFTLFDFCVPAATMRSLGNLTKYGQRHLT